MVNMRVGQLVGLAAVLVMMQGWSAEGVYSTAPQVRSGGNRDVRLGAHVDSSQLAVDGAKTPELIPDALAYKHFLDATSRGSSEQDRYVRGLQLDRLGLSDRDRQAYLAIVEPLRSQLAAPSPIIAEPEVVKTAVTRLRSGLSAEGFQLVDAHVKSDVKQKIKIYTSK